MAAPTLTVVAHRGASARSPENTLAAFAGALALGVDVIESDVRATRDGALVLSHDADLFRLTGRPDKVEDLDLAAIRQIVVGTDAAHGEQTMPALGELLHAVGDRARILLDLKLPTGHEREVLGAVRAAGAEGTVIVGVRSVASLQAFKRVAPRLPILAFGRSPEAVWEMAGVGADLVRLWSNWLDGDLLRRAGQLGKPVWIMCGTPGAGKIGETTLRELLAYRRGGAAGAILNDPQLALRANALATP